MVIDFESKTCDRCNGTGRINAYSHVYNGVCFGCGGNGSKATRRGAAARKAYNLAMSIPASELEIGMIVWQTGLDNKDRRRKIESIKPSTTTAITDGISIPMIDVAYASKDSIRIHTMPTTNQIRMALSPTNRHLAIKALANMKGATITEGE
jgi:hypothetical protein